MPSAGEPAMRVDVWSDVVCPFCYIGKRRLEAALAGLPHSDSVEVVWHAFQLLPDLVTDPARNAVQNMAERKGWPMAYARQVAGELTALAAADGLAFHYEQTRVANTFDAHRLQHFATTQGKGDAMAEALFKAFFTDGRNIADPDTLAALASSVGLQESQAREVLASDAHAEDVRRDIDRALQLGVTGVPFFVIDGRYAVSGAQDSSIFRQALQRALADSNARERAPKAETVAITCRVDGECP